MTQNNPPEYRPKKQREQGLKSQKMRAKKYQKRALQIRIIKSKKNKEQNNFQISNQKIDTLNSKIMKSELVKDSNRVENRPLNAYQKERILIAKNNEKMSLEAAQKEAPNRQKNIKSESLFGLKEQFLAEKQAKNEQK